MLIEMEKIKWKKKIIDDFVFVKVFIILPEIPLNMTQLMGVTPEINRMG